MEIGDDMAGAAHQEEQHHQQLPPGVHHPAMGVGVPPSHHHHSMEGGGPMPPPGEGYYNDLLSRVDTVTQTRSAYGGAHAAEASNSSRRRDGTATSSEWAAQFADAVEASKVNVVWGRDGDGLDAEARLSIVATFALSALALSFELAADKIHWFAQWFLATLLSHVLAVAAKVAVSRLPAPPSGGFGGDVLIVLTSVNRRSFACAILVALLVWAVVDMATFDEATVGQGFRVWIAVVTLGAILVEATARLYVRFVQPRLPEHLRIVGRTPAEAAAAAEETDLQYAAL